MRALGLPAALGLGLLASFAAASAPPGAADAQAPSTARTQPAVAPEALQALRRMSAYLSTLSSFEAQSQTSLDLVTLGGQRVQLDGTVTYRVRRPDAFTIDVDTDRKKRRYIYDGKHFTVYSPELGYYSTVVAPPTIRQTLDAIADRFGIVLPLEDLFRWNDPGGRVDQLDSGFDVGPATIDGVQTEQYAFRQGKTDWQVWIQKGDQPLPRKLVIIDRRDPANPAYVARLGWTLNPTLTAADFAFQPGKDAKAIPLTTPRQP